MNSIHSFFKKNNILVWIIGFQFFRFIMTFFVGLMPQDAYYYMYSQHLDWSYFDHPSMIAIILRFFTEIFGDSLFAIKFADFFISSLTIYFFYIFCRFYLSSKRALTATLLFSSTLLVSIVSLNTTPDVPLLLFWTLSLICFHKAIFQQKKIFWIFAGIAIGLSFNSKYTAVFLPFSLLIFLLFSKKHKSLLRSKWLWFCLLISVVFLFPILYWNHQNSFASFTYQATNKENLPSDILSILKRLAGVFGHQSLLIIPILFWFILTITFKYGKKFFKHRKKVDDKILFLFAFFIPTFFGFLCFIPNYWIKLNWMMPCYISIIVLSSIFITKKLINYQLVITIVLHVLFVVEILFYPIPIKSDDTWFGWKKLAENVEQLQLEHPNTFVFSEDSYKTTAALDFYTTQKIYAQNIIGLKALQYDYIENNFLSLKGKNAIFLDSDKKFINNEKSGAYHPNIDSYFDEVIELEPIILKKGNRELRKFWVFLCKNYQPKK